MDAGLKVIAGAAAKEERENQPRDETAEMHHVCRSAPMPLRRRFEDHGQGASRVAIAIPM